MTKFTDRIKTYNQYILAIAGTIGIFILLFLAIMAFDEMTNSWFYNDPDYNDGIIATEVTNELTKDSLRKQIISFNSMILIDSANQIFILPVSHASLGDEEYNSSGLLNLYSSSKNNYSQYRPESFNNLVLYENINSTSEVIFKRRLGISNYFNFNFEKKNFIVITASQKDTNEDGVLNQLDFQQMFVYDLSKRTLFEMDTPDNFTILDAFTPQRSNSLFVQIGADRNQNNFFDRSEEPKIFYKVDINSMVLKEIIETEKLDRLQKLLEGR